MRTKRSQQNPAASRTSVGPPHRSGTLYVVAVSIGHPEDVTMRAIRVLGEVDLIASENPNMTQQLLAHHGIHAKVTSYGPRHLREKAEVLLHRLRLGATIAFVADTGSPLVADPGSLLVAGSHAQGTPVIPIPGPSVVIAALSAAGFPCESFYFLGHLPHTAPALTRCLTEALKRDVPAVAFCSNKSLVRVLQTMGCLAPQRLVVVTSDLTRSNELILRGTPQEVSQRLTETPREDITIVLQGKNRGG